MREVTGHRRMAWRVGVCLLLGVCTTVGVAWVLTFDLHGSDQPMRFADAGTAGNGRKIRVARRDSLGAWSLAAATTEDSFTLPPEQTVGIATIVPGWARGELLDWTKTAPEPTPTSSTCRAILVTGWPVGSMWSSYDQQPSAGYWWFKARDGIVVAAAPASPDHFALLSPRERVLPTRVVWGGFLMSTLFWGAVWCVLVFGPIVLRRAMRRRRGACEGCGYDRGGLADDGACPECGGAAKRPGVSGAGVGRRDVRRGG